MEIFSESWSHLTLEYLYDILTWKIDLEKGAKSMEIVFYLRDIPIAYVNIDHTGCGCIRKLSLWGFEEVLKFSEKFSGRLDVIMNMINSWMLILKVKEAILEDLSRIRVRGKKKNYTTSLRLLRILQGLKPVYYRYGYTLGFDDRDLKIPSIPLSTVRDYLSKGFPPENPRLKTVLADIDGNPEIQTLGIYVSHIYTENPDLYEDFSVMLQKALEEDHSFFSEFHLLNEIMNFSTHRALKFPEPKSFPVFIKLLKNEK